MDCEGGLLSVRERGIDYIRCESFTDVAEAVAFARTNAGGYETVVVDSLTEIGRLAVEATVRRPSDASRAAAPTLAEWGRCVQVVRQVIRGFTTLPTTVVFTALPRDLRSAGGELLGVKPWLPGRLADEVAAAMDFVLFLYGKEEEKDEGNRAYLRMFLTAPHRRVFAKDRSGTLPLWVDPTWTALSRYLSSKDSTEPAVAA